MKKILLIAMASAVMLACSKSEQSPADDPQDGSVVFDLSASSRSDGTTVSKTPVYSQEAVQHVTRVTVYAFMLTGSDYVFTKSYDVPGWTDGLTFKRYVVADNNKLAPGDYKFLAVGRDASDQFTVTAPTASSTKFQDMTASISAAGNETEIFAGSGQAQVMSQGTRVTITMTRQVAGVLGYFKNVPQELDGQTVKYLRLIVSNANKQVNLTSGVGAMPVSANDTLFNMDLSGQAVNGGIYAGNDLSAQGVQKIANSQLNGAFVMPVAGITMTLGLYSTSNAVIRTWTVYDNGNSSFDLIANHFYSLGKKVQASSTTGGTPDPGDDDQAIDLLVDQAIVISISPAWTAIDDLIIQPNPIP